MPVRPLFVLLLFVVVRPLEARQAADPFAWDDATVYRIVTDRFSNGDSDNDGAYGRGLDGNGTPYEVDSTGHFLGGDFRGISGWIEDGYFSRLGVNTLQITAPFEQVHGWSGRGRTQRYAFDGSMPLDYTQTDEAFGTLEDFEELVRTAHADGLRLLIEVRLSGPGPVTLHDMVELGFGSIRDDTWRSWRGAGSTGSWNEWDQLFLDHQAPDSAWTNWWGPAWIRADLPGYQPCEGACPESGASFRVDPDSLSIPDFLRRKWGAEKSEAERAALDEWFEQTGYPHAAAYAVVKWISDWIREHGVDGVVVQDAGAVDPAVLSAMQREGASSLADYRAGRGGQQPAPDVPFWLVGCGLDAPADTVPVDATCETWMTAISISEGNEMFAERATTVAEASGIRAVASIAGGSFSEENPLTAAAQVLLSPGPVAIVYGQEAGMHGGGARIEGPEIMDWIAADDSVRAVWQAIGSFRAAHPAVSRGGHEVLSEDPTTFFRGVRLGQDVDRIVVVLGAAERTRLNVARIWPDDTALRDAMTGNIALVTFGQVTMMPGPSGILLIEEVPE